MADRLLLTKSDLANLDVLRGLQDRLGGLNPAAPQIIAKNGVVDPASLFDAGLYDPKTKAFCLTFDEPIHGDALDLWLEALLLLRGADLLRIKGIINVVDLDGPVVIHGVQHIFHPAVMLKEWPSEDRRSRIVFITRDIDESILRDTLKMFTNVKAQRSELLPEESGDSDIAMFEVRP